MTMESHSQQVTLEGRTMPEHWKLQFSWIPSPLHVVVDYGLRYLCLISLGHANLQAVYDVCCSDRATWMESTERLYDRLNTIVVVVRLIQVGGDHVLVLTALVLLGR